MSDEIVLYPTNRKVNDAGEVLIPNLNALEQRVKELETNLFGATATVAALEAKLAEVERERDRLREALGEVEMELEGRYDGTLDSPTRWMGSLLLCIEQALKEG